MFFLGLFFLAVCLAGPIYLLSAPRAERRVTAEASDASPTAYFVCGALVGVPAAYAWTVVSVGFLFPGWGLLRPNALTAFRISLPNGRLSAGPKQYLSPRDTDMSFMLSALCGCLMLLGAYLVLRGVWLLRAKHEES